jgi:hypothetical protein
MVSSVIESINSGELDNFFFRLKVSALRTEDMGFGDCHGMFCIRVRRENVILLTGVLVPSSWKRGCRYHVWLL